MANKSYTPDQIKSLHHFFASHGMDLLGQAAEPNPFPRMESWRFETAASPVFDSASAVF